MTNHWQLGIVSAGFCVGLVHLIRLRLIANAARQAMKDLDAARRARTLRHVEKSVDAEGRGLSLASQTHTVAEQFKKLGDCIRNYRDSDGRGNYRDYRIVSEWTDDGADHRHDGCAPKPKIEHRLKPVIPIWRRVAGWIALAGVCGALARQLVMLMLIAG